MEPSTYAVCQAAKWLKSSVERLSGNSEYAPFWSPTSPRNGVQKRHLVNVLRHPNRANLLVRLFSRQSLEGSTLAM
jgi:hypothetical protein